MAAAPVTGCALCAVAREHGGRCPVHSPGSREWPHEPGDGGTETRALPATLDGFDALIELLEDRAAFAVEFQHDYDGEP